MENQSSPEYKGVTELMKANPTNEVLVPEAGSTEDPWANRGHKRDSGAPKLRQKKERCGTDRIRFSERGGCGPKGEVFLKAPVRSSRNNVSNLTSAGRSALRWNKVGEKSTLRCRGNHPKPILVYIACRDVGAVS